MASGSQFSGRRLTVTRETFRRIRSFILLLKRGCGRGKTIGQLICRRGGVPISVSWRRRNVLVFESGVVRDDGAPSWFMSYKAVLIPYLDPFIILYPPRGFRLDFCTCLW